MIMNIIEQMANNSTFILNLNGKTVLQKIKIINYLCDIPEVQTVSTYKYPKLSNSLMTAYTQFNNKNFKRYRNSQYYYLDRYLNSYGITGENEVITIIDSLIDFNHAMFRDDNKQVEFNKLIPNHRKIVYYTYDGNMTKWENEISEYEHGTHVAGTAAGKSICSNEDVSKTSMFNGNAPDAKIAYGGSTILIDFFKLNTFLDEVKSKISSNSWGNDYYSNQMNFDFGSLALINPNVTFISAAGNFYEHLGNFSICDPQGSKNVLTVGALGDYYSDKDSSFVITCIKNPELSFVANDVNFKDIMINATIGNVSGKTDIYAFESTDKKCGNLLNNNKFLIYGGGDISWINDCEYNEDPNFIYSDDKTTIQKILDLKSDVLLSKNFRMDKNKNLLRTNYSSTGPASKGILKPDLMAPGSKIISAKSRLKSSNPHGCGNSKDEEFIIMNGTSMAASNIAGAAALIRQYFNSGKWINKVILDGETTRALLINSCKYPLDSKTPDIMYGHCVVDLSTVIPIEGDFCVQITPQRTDINTSSANLLDEIHHKPFVTKNGHVVAKLEVNTSIKSTKLQITLSYLDSMINMDSPIPLVRDLDLIVTSPSNRIYYGDHLYNKDTRHLSTNEKIIIDENELENGIYTIHVYGGNYIDSIFTEMPKEQEFSVVASGPINNGTIIFSNSNECPCNECNQNMPGFCICEKNTQIGQACQINIETINGNTGLFTLKPLEIKRVMFSSNKIVKKIYSTSDNPGHESTIWASKNCHLTLNEYEINGYTSKTLESNSGIDVNFGLQNICISIFNNNDNDATYKIEVSDGYTSTSIFKASDLFSGSFVFTKSFYFSESNEFTKSKLFSENKLFTKSKYFSMSQKFKSSDLFSKSYAFTKSFYFLESNEFTKSKLLPEGSVYTKSNFISKNQEFKSNSASYSLTKSNLFSKSQEYTKSRFLSKNHEFKESDFFSGSQTYTKSQLFSTYECNLWSSKFTNIQISINSQFFSKSNEYSDSQLYSSKDTFIKSESFYFDYDYTYKQSFSFSNDFLNQQTPKYYSQSNNFINSFHFTVTNDFTIDQKDSFEFHESNIFRTVNEYTNIGALQISSETNSKDYLAPSYTYSLESLQRISSQVSKITISQSVTYTIVRSVSFSISLLQTHSYFMSYDLSKMSYIYMSTQGYSIYYHPYIIYYFSQSYTILYIYIPHKKVKITKEKLIGISCISASVFFFIFLS